MMRERKVCEEKASPTHIRDLISSMKMSACVASSGGTIAVTVASTRMASCSMSGGFNFTAA